MQKENKLNEEEELTEMVLLECESPTGIVGLMAIEKSLYNILTKNNMKVVE